jgi:hypothetical protein
MGTLRNIYKQPSQKNALMKVAIDAEDAIIGIICGLLLLGLTGTFFELELSDIVYAITSLFL